MIILKETINPQTILFIPREYKANCIVIVNETTNVEVEIKSDFYKSGYYLQTTAIFDLKEGNFYNISIKNNDKIVYLDKIYCTNQDINTFSVNKNEYTAHESNNDYIIYE